MSDIGLGDLTHDELVVELRDMASNYPAGLKTLYSETADRIERFQKELADRDEVIADYSKVVAEGVKRLEDADERLAKAERERDSLGRRCAIRFGEREEARAEARQYRDELELLRSVVEAAKDYREVFNTAKSALNITASRRELFRAVDALAAAEMPTGVGTSGAGSKESGRSVASDESDESGSTDDELKLLRAQRATLLNLLAHIDGVGNRHNGPYPQAAWVSSDTIRDILSDENAASECASCGGTRWVDDENWQPEDYERGRKPLRQPGSGRIPCGGCNHGGWNVDDGAAEVGGRVIVEVLAQLEERCDICSRKVELVITSGGEYWRHVHEPSPKDHDAVCGASWGPTPAASGSGQAGGEGS